MEPKEKNKERKWTNIILVMITAVILIYIVYTKGISMLGFGKNVTLDTGQQLIKLDEKERTYVGINARQIYKVTANGINTYNFDKTEIWSDTFSMKDFEVMQKEPYILIGGKQGRNLSLYGKSGKVCDITTENPIVKFSVNEAGGIVVIESGDNSYTVSAYDRNGKRMCSRVSYISADGYPTDAVLSPDNSLLIMSYVSVDNPQVESNILAMNTRSKNSNSEESVDNTVFGYIEKNNLVYNIEYINKDTWACVGDKAITWYDNNGKVKGKQQKLSPVFIPQLQKKSSIGSGYLPVVLSEKPTQNVVHRQDKLAYFDENGKKTYEISLNGGVESYYADDTEVIVKVGGTYKGFNRLCNSIFEYAPAIDISRVIYVPGMKKGIAVSKDSVYLITPKKKTK